MKIHITCDQRTCLLAGVEPADHLDIDMDSVAPEDRALLASALDRDMRLQLVLPVPTVASALEAIRAAQAEAQAAQAAAMAAQAAAQAAQAAAMAWVQERHEYTSTVRLGAGPLSVEYTERGMTSAPYCYPAPEGFRALRDAWLDDVQAANAAARACAEAEHDRLITIGIAARAAMPAGEIISEDGAAIFGLAASGILPLDLRTWHPVRIISDDGGRVVLATTSRRGPIYRGLTVRLGSDSARVAAVEAWDEAQTESVETTQYPVRDGVITIDGSTWAATSPLTDAKPSYSFLDRAPGGYVAGGLSQGSLLIWGSKDRQGRKQGPWDRLVYHVDATHVYVVKTNYHEARGLVQRVMAAQAQPALP